MSSRNKANESDLLRPNSAPGQRNRDSAANNEESPLLGSNTPNQRRSQSAPMDQHISANNANFSLGLNRKATRNSSILSRKYTLTRGQGDYRIATWNLLSFSKTKSSDPNVLQTIVGIILNNRLDVVAVQELADREGLKVVCAELNNTNTGTWQCKVSERAGKMYRSSEYLGYLWNSSRAIDIKSDRLLTGNKSFARSPYLANFKINKQNLLMVNVHLKAVGLSGEDIERTRGEVDSLSILIESIYNMTSNSSVHTLLLGDFNLSPNSDFNKFYLTGYQNLLPKDTPTNISARNPRGSRSYDNIWVSIETLHTVYGGENGVIREGLVDEAVIRENREPTISDHCPVWASFKI